MLFRATSAVIFHTSKIAVESVSTQNPKLVKNGIQKILSFCVTKVIEKNSWILFKLEWVLSWCSTRPSTKFRGSFFVQFEHDPADKETWRGLQTSNGRMTNTSHSGETGAFFAIKYVQQILYSAPVYLFFFIFCGRNTKPLLKSPKNPSKYYSTFWNNCRFNFMFFFPSYFSVLVRNHLLCFSKNILYFSFLSHIFHFTQFVDNFEKRNVCSLSQCAYWRKQVTTFFLFPAKFHSCSAVMRFSAWFNKATTAFTLQFKKLSTSNVHVNVYQKSTFTWLVVSQNSFNQRRKILGYNHIAAAWSIYFCCLSRL